MARNLKGEASSPYRFPQFLWLQDISPQIFGNPYLVLICNYLILFFICKNYNLLHFTILNLQEIVVCLIRQLNWLKNIKRWDIISVLQTFGRNQDTPQAPS